MSSSLRLEKVTADNVEAACRLQVRPDQEEFVDPVAWSLAEAYAQPEIAWPRLIFDGEQLVGFVMGFFMVRFNPDDPDDTPRCGIWRLNIAADQQGRGYGRFAVESVCAEVRRRGQTRATVTWAPGEHGPERFYLRLGFRPTGEKSGDQVVGELALTGHRDAFQMGPAEVRRLTTEDWKTFRDVRLAALADAPEAFSSSLGREQAYDEARWRAGMLPERGVKAVAVVEGRVAGVAGGWVPEDRGGAVEVYGMWVDPAARGAGVGALLVEEVVAWAAEHGHRRVELWVVDGNDGAARLYRRLGFEATGESEPHTNDPGVHERLMARVLDARPRGPHGT
ncbi:GNAT family N-acetyltransferase [Streptosporangium sp. NPDC005286]|uniref:GNAT family N-acetyltransferase n=1 Tax=Streptosporangium sp. NPDC005286 TaxID=3154463 RepID=UPI0033A33106